MSNLTPINQADQSFLTIEHVAEELHQTTEGVESKCRRRCSNPIPFHNVGNHRLFVWSEVFNWVTSSPKIIHSRHRRRTKEEIDAVGKAKARKAQSAGYGRTGR
jgi:hypothetical protein